jgi:hypothetical protein
MYDDDDDEHFEVGVWRCAVIDITFFFFCFFFYGGGWRRRSDGLDACGEWV